MNSMEFSSTAELPVPKDPLSMVIGQEEAVSIARLAAKQRRHLLLVGAPGTGKSMIARAIASIIPSPSVEISVLHNMEKPERPALSVRNEEMIAREKKEKKEFGAEVRPSEVPTFVTERLGLRCRRCAALSPSRVPYCPSCGAEKSGSRGMPVGGVAKPEDICPMDCVEAVHISENGDEEPIFYERTSHDKILMLGLDELEERERQENALMRNVLVPLSRSTFVAATGNNETELLGDVRHDPYGGHPEIGTPPYSRVAAGAVHEAHEGVLFIDEMATLGETQRYLLTAMQEKKFPITGRNSTSAGATVRVESVPCDFILVGALNINDLGMLSPALRSRIRGSGYEIVLNTWMQDSEENREQLAQFVAQEIRKDGKVPHASAKAVEAVISEAKRICKRADGRAGLTLRLRSLSGIIKLAGDLAATSNSELIGPEHISLALKSAKPAEDQLDERYGNWWGAANADHGHPSKPSSGTA